MARVSPLFDRDVTIYGVMPVSRCTTWDSTGTKTGTTEQITAPSTRPRSTPSRAKRLAARVKYSSTGRSGTVPRR